MNEKKIFTNEKGNLILEISEDDILANLIIKNTGDVIDEKEIVDLIRKANIRSGLERASKFVKENGIEKEFDQPFLVALSLDPEQQANIKYLFDESSLYDPRKFKSITELNHLYSVEKEQPLAEIIFTDLEKTNQDIFGNEIKPAINKNQIIHNYLGNNVYYSVYKKQIMSSKAGYPYIDENKRINIRSDFEINRDLTEESLHIVGNLTLNGNVDNSELNIDGNLKVNGRIFNCGGQGIVVYGNIEVDSAENSRILCKENLKFKKSLRFCTIAADKKIVGGEESSIIGGLIRGETSIEAANIGSPFSMMTDVEVALSPFTKELIINYEGQLKELKKKSSRNAAKIKILADKISKMQEQYEEKVFKHLEEDTEEHFIKATRKAFPEIQLRIHEKTRNITRELNGFNFISQEDGSELNES